MEKRDEHKKTKKERTRSSGSFAGSPPVSPQPHNEQQALSLSSSSSGKLLAPELLSVAPSSPTPPAADTRIVGIKSEEHTKIKSEGHAQKPFKSIHHSRAGAGTHIGKPGASKAAKVKSPRPSEAQASRSRSSSSSSVSTLTSSSSLASLDDHPGASGRSGGAPLSRKHKKRRHSSGKHKKTRRVSLEPTIAALPAQKRGSSDADLTPTPEAAALSGVSSPDKPSAGGRLAALSNLQEVSAPEVAKKRWLRQSIMSGSGVRVLDVHSNTLNYTFHPYSLLYSMPTLYNTLCTLVDISDVTPRSSSVSWSSPTLILNGIPASTNSLEPPTPAPNAVPPNTPISPMPAAVGRAPSTGLHLLHIAADLLESEPDAAPESTQAAAAPPLATTPLPATLPLPVASGAPISSTQQINSTTPQIGALDILLRAASATSVSLETADSVNALASSLSAAEAAALANANPTTPSSALPRNKAYLKFQSSLSTDSSALATDTFEASLLSASASAAAYASPSTTEYPSQMEQYAAAPERPINRLASLDNNTTSLSGSALSLDASAKVLASFESLVHSSSTPPIMPAAEPPSFAAPPPPQKKKVTLSEYKTRRQQSNAPSSASNAASESAQPTLATELFANARLPSASSTLAEPEGSSTGLSTSSANLEGQSGGLAVPAAPVDSLAASIVNVLQKTGHSNVLANLGKSLFRAPLGNPSLQSQSAVAASPSPSASAVAFMPPFLAPSSSLLSALIPSPTSARELGRSPLPDPLAVTVTASAVEHQAAAHVSPHTPTQDDEIVDGAALSPNGPGPLADSSEPALLAAPHSCALSDAPAIADAASPPSDEHLVGQLEQLRSSETPLIRPQSLPT